MAEQYPNRSDLRNPAQKVAKQVVPGQTYGEGAAQMRSQQAVPMASAPTDMGSPQVSAPPTPGSLGDFLRQTERPEEEATFGSSIGPGPGPEVFGGNPGIPEQWSKVDLVQRVRAVASMYPSPVLLAFLAELEQS
jgi:hypothetical protein